MTASPPFRRLIVTGANGYIGRAVVDAALKQGCEVAVLGRAFDTHDLQTFPWRLGDPIPGEALNPAFDPADHALVHLAHDWRAPRHEEDANIGAARVLRNSRRNLGLGRLVFVSSLSARPDALNIYGRTKYAIEQVFDGPSDVSLRVGLVYGGPRTAMYGLLTRIVGLTPILPMIRPHQAVQPIHRREVAEGVLNAALGDMNGPLGLAASEPIAFAAFLSGLANATAGRGVMTLPAPLAPILAMARILNALPSPIKVDQERILGLAGNRFVETKGDLERLGLHLAPFVVGLAGEPQARRLLLAEANGVLAYCLGRRPSPWLLRRYARAVATREGRAAKLLPRSLWRWPALLRIVEPIGGQGRLRRRLNVALSLIETSPEGEHALAKHGRLSRICRLALAAPLEVLLLPVRFAVGGLVR